MISQMASRRPFTAELSCHSVVKVLCGMEGAGSNKVLLGVENIIFKVYINNNGLATLRFQYRIYHKKYILSSYFGG